MKKATENRAGIVLVSTGTLETWVGEETQSAIKEVLDGTPFTVVWKAFHSHLLPTGIEGSPESHKFQVVGKYLCVKEPPFNEILSKICFFS